MFKWESDMMYMKCGGGRRRKDDEKIHRQKKSNLKEKWVEGGRQMWKAWTHTYKYTHEFKAHALIGTHLNKTILPTPITELVSPFLIKLQCGLNYRDICAIKIRDGFMSCVVILGR